MRLFASVVTAVMLAVNYLSSTGVFGRPMDQISNVFPFSFMPPGRTFAIARGIIYLLLVIWIGRSWTAAGRKDPLNNALFPRYLITCVLNIARIWLTSMEAYGLAVLVMAVLCVILGIILNYLHAQPTAHVSIKKSFGAYFGRVSIATTTLALSQLVFLRNEEIVQTPLRLYGILLLAVCVTRASRKRRQNTTQLIFSIRAFIGIAYSLMF